MSDNQQKGDNIDMIDQQINRISHIIDKLLEDIDLDKLTMAHKSNSLTKLISLLYRYLVLKNSIKPDELQARESSILAAFQRYLRGEEPREE